MKHLLLISFCFLALQFSQQLRAQGCSDAGFCTLGNHANETEISGIKNSRTRSEIDIQYTAARHGHNERFSVPQLNYRLFNTKGSFFEIRLPLNIAKDRSSGISNTGIGDITTTFNSTVAINKTSFFSYAVGLRVSLSHADATYNSTSITYPMFLQAGLGTTDLLAVANYSFCKYLSVGTGVQIPILQYNKNQKFIETSLDPIFLYNLATNFHRQADALLRLDGNLAIRKLEISGGLIGIFHLKNDYYTSYKSISTGIDYGHYELFGSQGTTINLSVNFLYPISKKINLGLLYASPLKTRSNIPDGLARSLVISPKITIAL